MEKIVESHKMWGGRFDGNTDSLFDVLNRSIQTDYILWKQDIQGSKAYAAALSEAGIITQDEKEALTGGLDLVAAEWEAGKFSIKSSDEDVHTANERRLTELIGPVGGKLHTGRSRNDQVAVDIKLWIKDDIRTLSGHLKELINAMAERAEKGKKILIPGYTHLQRAQPVRWSHWILRYAWFLMADFKRLGLLLESVDSCPLGSGAIAGNPFNIDRFKMAATLGFQTVTDNSMMAVSDRDFVAEYLFWGSMVSTHLSSIAEDLIIYSTSEFGFARLSDLYSTGSSLMPQKRNPDSLELIRGKAAVMQGKLSSFLSLMKGLPSTYNKDLQEDKELLFSASKTLHILLPLMKGIINTVKVNEDVARSQLTDFMLTTDLAYYLVRKGVPFRKAHEAAGKVVKLAEDRNQVPSSLGLEDYKNIHSSFEEDVKQVWDYERSVEQYRAYGGTALESVEQQIKNLRARLNKTVL